MSACCWHYIDNFITQKFYSLPILRPNILIAKSNIPLEGHSHSIDFGEFQTTDTNCRSTQRTRRENGKNGVFRCWTRRMESAGDRRLNGNSRVSRSSVSFNRHYIYAVSPTIRSERWRLCHLCTTVSTFLLYSERTRNDFVLYCIVGLIPTAHLQFKFLTASSLTVVARSFSVDSDDISRHYFDDKY